MLITDQPENIPTTNALADIPDDLLGGPPPPADIILASKTLTTLADPPGRADTIVLMVRLRVYDIGVAYGDNGEGEPTHYRKTKLVSCWLPSDPEPEIEKTQAEIDAEAAAEAAKAQPPLFGDDPDAELGDTFAGRPPFSDGEA